MHNEQAPVLECEDLCVSYHTRGGEIPAVLDFSLALRAGETIGLVGESGCGKSTVAMAIMQYLGRNGEITGGRVRFRGEEITQMPEAKLRTIRGSRIAMVYQEANASLNPSMKIGRQLMEVPMTHDKLSASDAYQRTVKMLSEVQLPDPERIMQAYPHQLSGGQQQRVVIAMGLLSQPDVLLLDEPTTSLDVTVEAGIVRLIAGLSRKFGSSQIYISHNLGLILEACDRVLVMYSGEVVEEGAVGEIFARPAHPYTRGLLACIPRPAADKHRAPLRPIRGQLPLPQERPAGCFFGPRCDYFSAGECDGEAIGIQRIDGGMHRVRCVRWRLLEGELEAAQETRRAAMEFGEKIISVSGLKKYYSLEQGLLRRWLEGAPPTQVKANQGISFDLREGETLAMVGESGCGKSTFAKVLSGLETATDGSIRFREVELAQLSLRERTSAQISALQMVFQNPFETLNPAQTIGAQLSRAVRKLSSAEGGTAVRERVLALLEMVKMPRDFYARRPRQLSGGQKQRVAIARAFAGMPEIVIADEPLSSLDVSVAAAITELLMNIQQTHRTSLLFISHDLNIVRYLADQVIVIYLGQVMERGTRDAVFSPPFHPYTEALLSAVPVADPELRKREIILEGDLPSVLDLPEGCPFAGRCPRRAGDICEQEAPPEREISGEHMIRCHLEVDELARVKAVIQKEI